MRIQAIRASETLYKAGHRSLLDDYRGATKDPDTDVVIQGMLTLSLFKAPDLSAVVKATQTTNQSPRRAAVRDVGPPDRRWS